MSRLFKILTFTTSFSPPQNHNKRFFQGLSCAWPISPFKHFLLQQFTSVWNNALFSLAHMVTLFLFLAAFCISVGPVCYREDTLPNKACLVNTLGSYVELTRFGSQDESLTLTFCSLVFSISSWNRKFLLCSYLPQTKTFSWGTFMFCCWLFPFILMNFFVELL